MASRPAVLPVVLALALAVVPSTVRAQQQQLARDTARIAPIVVTGTRTAVAADRAPSATTLITGEQLRQQGITTVIDALRQAPGLAIVQTGSFGGTTSLFIRGGESKFTKVLIDGVPVNDAGGAFNFASLSTDNLDRIEIVRGPASVLYGSDAMAGVVQIFTRPGTERRRADLSARGGQYGSYDVDASASGIAGRVNYSLGGARHSTEGIQQFNSGYRQNVASARMGVPGEMFDGALSMRYSDNALHYPTDGSGQVVDSNAVRRDGRLSLGFDGGVRVTPRMQLRVALASYDVHAATDDQPDSRADTLGYNFATGERSRRRSGDLRLDALLPYDSRLIVGAQMETQWQDSQTESNFGPNSFTANRSTTGSYAQLLVTPGTNYTATVGVRYERNEQFGDFTTGRAAASARLAPNTRLRGSVGTAFREPTFIESYGGPFATGNSALTPEHAVSVDVGVEQGIGDRASVAVTWFNNSYRDLIDYKFSTTAPHFFNVARTRAAGAELEGRITLAPGLTANATFTYLETRVIDPGLSSSKTAAFLPGARLLRRPMHTFDAGIGYHVARGGLGIRAHRVGTREDNFFAPDFTSRHVTLAPYTKVDLSGELALVPASVVRGRAAATLRVENLFDERYTNVAGVNFDFARTDNASVRGTGYRGAGRRALVGLRVSY